MCEYKIFRSLMFVKVKFFLNIGNTTNQVIMILIANNIDIEHRTNFGVVVCSCCFIGILPNVRTLVTLVIDPVLTSQNVLMVPD